MNPVLWMLAGVGISALCGLAFFLVAEPEFREAAGQVAAAVFLAPTILLGALIRTRSPRALRLSPEALKRFASATTGRPGESAWLIAYRGRGVIVVRRRAWAGSVNDVASTATRGRADAERDARRPVVRVRDTDPEVER